MGRRSRRSRSSSIPSRSQRILHSESGHNTIFDVDVQGSARAKAMIVDWQYEPIKGHLLHIDLKRIAMDKAMRVEVPIQLVGIPVGVKTEGGIWIRCCAKSRSSACRRYSERTSTSM